MELKARKNIKPAAAPQTLQDRINDGYGSRESGIGAGMGAGGAAEAVGVLNAVDEDEEGEGEADLPKQFDYHSDGGEE